jgi:hypothetical protein
VVWQCEERNLSRLHIAFNLESGNMVGDISDMKKSVLSLLIIVLFICGILIFGQNLLKNTDNMSPATNLKNKVVSTKIICHYLEPVNGTIESFDFKIKSDVLKDVLNDWLSELLVTDVSYGNTSSGENILKTLAIIDTYYVGTDLVIVMNDAFEAFEISQSITYTQPGDFLFGLKSIVSQVTVAESMTIEFSSKKSSTIHQDGVVIDEIPLK